MHVMRWPAAIVVAASIIGGSHASAQSTTGSFQGTVTDQSGAALPGVTITIVNTQTNLTRTTVTNTSGNYDAPLLPPGPYTISSELTGFRRLEKSGLVLQVTQNARIDFTLELSTVQESVQVTAQAPLVDTQDSAFRQVIDQTQVVALPLNGRNFRELGLLVPGVQEMAQKLQRRQPRRRREHRRRPGLQQQFPDRRLRQQRSDDRRDPDVPDGR